MVFQHSGGFVLREVSLHSIHDSITLSITEQANVVARSKSLVGCKCVTAGSVALSSECTRGTARARGRGSDLASRPSPWWLVPLGTRLFVYICE